MSTNTLSKEAQHLISNEDIETFFESLFAISRNVIAASPDLQVEKKIDKSLVTNIDKDVEEAFVTAIKQKFPTHTIIGEETGVTKGESTLNWRIDPIDGTEEMVNRMPIWGSIVGLFDGDTPIAGGLDFPKFNERMCGYRGRGLRYQGKPFVPPSPNENDLRVGICTLKSFHRQPKFMECELFYKLTTLFPNHRIFWTCYSHFAAAKGSLDLTIEIEQKDWDLAALQLLVEEGGGEYFVFNQSTNSEGLRVSSCVAGRPDLVEKTKHLLRECKLI